MYTLVVIVVNTRDFKFLAEKSTTSTDGWGEDETLKVCARVIQRQKQRDGEREGERRRNSEGVLRV